jgi:hypothetical protein
VRYGYGPNEILVLRQDLQDFAWSAPMRDLAPKVGLSDVGLKKLLKSYGVFTPPQGYWNRVYAGKPVPQCPKASARRPVETGRVGLDARFAQVLNTAEPPSSSGPFASAAVPEDLDELYEQELKAVGRVNVPRKLERAHYALAQIFKQEERRREKFAASNWSWDAPKLDSAVDRRRLRILNAIFMALSRRGHRAQAYERDGEIHATVRIGDMPLGLDIDVAAKRTGTRAQAQIRAGAALAASTPLALSLDPTFDRKSVTTWQDDRDGALETKLAEIVARIVVAGEAKFRRGLKEAEERAEQHHLWQEKRREEEIEARNRERLTRLRESGELLRQAEDLRTLIGRVREAVISGSVEVDRKKLEAWQSWALEEADRLDPILSGQIMAHLSDD